MQSIFWTRYWQHRTLVKRIPSNYWFSEIFRKIYHSRQFMSSLEIGGFPGYYSIWLKKQLGTRSALVDKHISISAISSLCKKNGLTINDISIFKSDIFKFNSSQRFDLVYSIGLIEHFDIPTKLLRQHWRLLTRNGVMMLAIPNFLGINGIFQLLFDPSNLQKHNLTLMQPEVFSKFVAKATGVKPEMLYYGGFNMWLEHPNIVQKIIIFMSLLLGYLFRLLKIDSKFTSPYLIAIAYKP